MNDDSINWQTKMFYYRKFRNSTSIWNKLYFCEIFFILVDIILKQIFIFLINCLLELLGLRWLIWWNLKHVVLSEANQVIFTARLNGKTSVFWKESSFKSMTIPWFYLHMVSSKRTCISKFLSFFVQYLPSPKLSLNSFENISFLLMTTKPHFNLWRFKWHEQCFNPEWNPAIKYKI